MKQHIPLLRRSLLRAAAITALGVAAAPAAMAQTWALFDDFNAGALNVNKWSGDEGRQTGGIRLEASRSVVSGQLRLSSRGYGDNQRNSGNTSSVRNSVLLVKSAAVNAMKGTITMRGASLVNCAANPTTTAARARLFGFFFNGGQPVPGSFMNDVFAGVQVQRFANSTDAAGLFRVVAFVGQCLDDNCVNASLFESREIGQVNLNVPVTVAVAWNKAGKNFSFQREADPVQTISYTVNDSAAPEGSSAKRVEVSSNIAQCAGTRAAINLTADFDNIYTNVLPATPAIVAPPSTDLTAESIVGSVN